MRYRLPLELELTILELAAPPLAIDCLHDRVDFFINASLVHRSLTPWAQDRLHDQFLYTYRPRPDDHARLEKRFEAGYSPDRPIRRLYLDLSRLPPNIDRREESRPDSVSATINGRVYGPVSSTGGPGGQKQVGSKAQEQGCEAVALYVQPAGNSNGGHWELCTMITSYSQALDTLWLKLPYMDLNIKNLPPPRVLYIDHGAAHGVWGLLEMLPLASETVLFLRNFHLGADGSVSGYDTRQMIFHHCSATEASLSEALSQFPHLETLVFFEPGVYDLASALRPLPTSLRHVHILERSFYSEHNPSDAQHVLPRLESFTYTLLSSGESAPQTHADDGPDQDDLAEVQQIVESFIDAPQCTFKYLRSTESPEDAWAGALASLKL